MSGWLAIWEGGVKRADLLELVRQLPDDVDLEKFTYTLYVRRQIEIGLADADAGRVVSLEEIDRMIDEWPE